MKNTKANILEAAKTLFNKLGIADVTLRRIASELKISQGNLNYHYKRREDILEALYFEMVIDFDARVNNIESTKIDLAVIYKQSRVSMFQMAEYNFIWRDLSQLLRENETILKHFTEVYQKRFLGYRHVFGLLVAAGEMRPSQIEQEYDHLANRLISYSDFWLSSVALYQTPLTPATITEHHLILFETFYPYLTTKGQKSYQKVLDRGKLKKGTKSVTTSL